MFPAVQIQSPTMAFTLTVDANEDMHRWPRSDLPSSGRGPHIQIILSVSEVHGLFQQMLQKSLCGDLLLCFQHISRLSFVFGTEDMATPSDDVLATLSTQSSDVSIPALVNVPIVYTRQIDGPVTTITTELMMKKTQQAQDLGESRSKLYKSSSHYLVQRDGDVCLAVSIISSPSDATSNVSKHVSNSFLSSSSSSTAPASSVSTPNANIENSNSKWILNPATLVGKLLAFLPLGQHGLPCIVHAPWELDAHAAAEQKSIQLATSASNTAIRSRLCHLLAELFHSIVQCGCTLPNVVIKSDVDDFLATGGLNSFAFQAVTASAHPRPSTSPTAAMPINAPSVLPTKTSLASLSTDSVTNETSTDAPHISLSSALPPSSSSSFSSSDPSMGTTSSPHKRPLTPNSGRVSSTSPVSLNGLLVVKPFIAPSIARACASINCIVQLIAALNKCSAFFTSVVNEGCKQFASKIHVPAHLNEKGVPLKGAVKLPLEMAEIVQDAAAQLLDKMHFSALHPLIDSFPSDKVRQQLGVRSISADLVADLIIHTVSLDTQPSLAMAEFMSWGLGFIYSAQPTLLARLAKIPFLPLDNGAKIAPEVGVSAQQNRYLPRNFPVMYIRFRNACVKNAKSISALVSMGVYEPNSHEFVEKIVLKRLQAWLPTKKENVEQGLNGDILDKGSRREEGLAVAQTRHLQELDQTNIAGRDNADCVPAAPSPCSLMDAGISSSKAKQPQDALRTYENQDDSDVYRHTLSPADILSLSRLSLKHMDMCDLCKRNALGDRETALPFCAVVTREGKILPADMVMMGPPYVPDALEPKTFVTKSSLLKQMPCISNEYVDECMQLEPLLIPGAPCVPSQISLWFRFFRTLGAHLFLPSYRRVLRGLRAPLPIDLPTLEMGEPIDLYDWECSFTRLILSELVLLSCPVSKRLNFLAALSAYLDLLPYAESVLVAKVFQGNRVMLAPSAIMRSLRGISWLPNERGDASMCSDLFAARSEIQAILGPTVSYLGGAVSLQVERALQLRTLSLDDVVFCIQRWTKLAKVPSIMDAKRIYRYLAWLANKDINVKERLSSQPWIVIPSVLSKEQEQSDTALEKNHDVDTTQGVLSKAVGGFNVRAVSEFTTIVGDPETAKYNIQRGAIENFVTAGAEVSHIVHSRTNLMAREERLASTEMCVCEDPSGVLNVCWPPELGPLYVLDALGYDPSDMAMLGVRCRPNGEDLSICIKAVLQGLSQEQQDQERLCTQRNTVVANRMLQLLMASQGQTISVDNSTKCDVLSSFLDSAVLPTSQGWLPLRESSSCFVPGDKVSLGELPHLRWILATREHLSNNDGALLQFLTNLGVQELSLYHVVTLEEEQGNSCCLATSNGRGIPAQPIGKAHESEQHRPVYSAAADISLGASTLAPVTLGTSNALKSTNSLSFVNSDRLMLLLRECTEGCTLLVDTLLICHSSTLVITCNRTLRTIRGEEVAEASASMVHVALANPVSLLGPKGGPKRMLAWQAPSRECVVCIRGGGGGGGGGGNGLKDQDIRAERREGVNTHQARTLIELADMLSRLVAEEYLRPKVAAHLMIRLHTEGIDMVLARIDSV